MSASLSLPAHLQAGNADAFSIGIGEVTLIGGTPIALSAPGVTAVVGANNSGKSTVLREIINALARPPRQEPNKFKVLSTLTIKSEGSYADMFDWFAKHVRYAEAPSNGLQAGFVGLHQAQPYPVHIIEGEWAAVSGHRDRLGVFHQFFSYYLTAEARLGLTAPQQARANVTDPPVHPLHYLQDDADLLAHIKALSVRLFQETLTLDRVSTSIRLRVGEPAVPAPPVDAVTAEYVQSLGALPELSEQGDGMKSLLGLLLPLVTATHPVFVIDEPEAFLHPPQAAALGQVLGELAHSKNLQIILATHDRNLLAGLLQAEKVDVSVVRLTRTGNATRAHHLEPQALRDVWTDPALRYTNVLDGLFHRLVVLAEGDQDCRFYAAALEHLLAQGSYPLTPTDVLFVPAGGKGGLVKLATALRAAQVPVIASPDLDILNNAGELKPLVDSLGGDWSTMAGDYATATATFRTPPVPRTVKDVCDDVAAALAGKMSENYTQEHYRAVKARIHVASPFGALKTSGMPAFPRGLVYAAAERLTGQLEAIGIVPVRVGELENFAPALAVGKGPAWLPAAIAAGAHTDSAAQEHARRIVDAYRSLC